MSVDIIIIGAGIAGVQVATTLASKGIQSILITDENYSPYFRMRLEEVVNGAEPDSISIHPFSWYEEKGIMIINDKVISLNRDLHTIGLESGKELRYSKLIIATGSHAFSFPIKGADGKSCVLRKMDDAIYLNKKLKEIDSLTIIGGGLLGLEAAVSIKEHYDIAVNVIESQGYILSKQLDKDSSKILKKEIEKHGIAVYEAVSVDGYKDGKLILSDLYEIPTDLILMSVGVRSEYSFLKDSGIELDRGIIVDSHLRTSDNDIYAIGDVAELNGQCFSLAMFAREQGIYVANDIIENKGEYIPSEPSSILKVAGIDVAFFGSQVGDKEVFSKGESHITCFSEHGILKGVILINAKQFQQRAKISIDKNFDKSIFAF